MNVNRLAMMSMILMPAFGTMAGEHAVRFEVKDPVVSVADGRYRLYSLRADGRLDVRESADLAYWSGAAEADRVVYPADVLSATNATLDKALAAEAKKVFRTTDGRLILPRLGPQGDRHLRLYELVNKKGVLSFDVTREAPETSRTRVEDWPVACDEVSSVPGELPSYLPKGHSFKLVWHDEFNGDKLDETKWSYRTNFWGKRFLAFADHGAEVKDGKVHLPLMFENGQYCSPHLQTGEVVWDLPQKPCGWGFWPFPKRRPAKFAHKYGYYECRCRLQQKPGWWSAFWLQAPAIGATLDPKHSGVELDVMESFHPGQVLPTCFHYNGYAYDYKGFKSDRSEGDAAANGGRGIMLDKTVYHVFGCLWEPDGYTVYVDGRQKDIKVGRGTDEAVSDVEQFVLISTECKWYRSGHATGKGVPELKDALGDAFIVDYVRVYDLEK